MEKAVLKASKREVIGKQVRALRRDGLLPAVIYGSHIAPVAISLNFHDASLTLAKVSSSQLVNVVVDDQVLGGLQRLPVAAAEINPAAAHPMHVAADHAAADQAFERGAHLVDVVGLFDRYLAHEHAAVLLHAHQAGLVERAERLAHRAARDAHAHGEIGFVELGAGRQLAAGDACAVVESVKAAFDIYAPVSGKITDANKALESNPGLINQGPYADGWIFELEVSSPAELSTLMTAAQYQEVVRQIPKH